MVNQPLVSVLMPVYNSESFLATSLQSILAQDYSKLEILIVDDGCTDQSMDIVQSFLDPRIVIIKNPENIGLAASLNRAITISTGEFLARMDADDIAHPSRISRQVGFLLDHPNVDVLGTSMQYFGVSHYLNHFPASHEACKCYLMLNVCFGHPTVMFRRHVFNSPANFYNPIFRQYSEEYDLWCRLADCYTFHNIQDVLLYYRTYPPSIKGEAENMRIKNSTQIRKNYITSYFGELSDTDWDTHCMAAFLRNIHSLEDIRRIDEWFRQLLSRNLETKAFNHDTLRTQLAERFFEVCYAFAGIRKWTMPYFYKSEWSTVFKPSAKKSIKFALKQLVKR